MERAAAEAERKRKEEEEALERAAHEAAEKEAALARLKQEKAMLLGTEPEKGPDVTQVIPLKSKSEPFFSFEISFMHPIFPLKFIPSSRIL